MVVVDTVDVSVSVSEVVDTVVVVVIDDVVVDAVVVVVWVDVVSRDVSRTQSALVFAHVPLKCLE